MRMILFISYCISFCLFLLSCEDSHIHHQQPGVKLEINPHLGEISTRSLLYGTFPEGSAIGITLFEPGTGSYEGLVYSNFKYTALGSGALQNWNPETDIYLSPAEGSAVAYYPYNSSLQDHRSISLSTSAQTDYLYSGLVNNISSKNPLAYFYMKHALACFRLKIKRGTYTGKGEISAVSVKSGSLGSSGVLNAETGALSLVSGLDSEIKLSELTRVIGENETEDFEILVIPGTDKKEIGLHITIDGVGYSATLPAISSGIKQGEIYACTITANGKGLETSGVSIENWYSAEDVTGNVIQANFKITIAGNTSGIAFSYAISGETVTITAVSIDTVSSINTVSLSPSSGASLSQSTNGVTKTITISNITEDVALVFDGVS